MGFYLIFISVGFLVCWSRIYGRDGIRFLRGFWSINLATYHKARRRKNYDNLKTLSKVREKRELDQVAIQRRFHDYMEIEGKDDVQAPSSLVTSVFAAVKREMEGLSVAKTTLSAFLHPSRSDDVQQGVLQLLSSLLLRYNEEFDGVVLAYFDIKVCDWTPKILSGLHPYLSLKLKAKLLLFSPKPGMLLEGTVNKVEKDYIGAIVLGIFNAAIAFSDIPEDLSYQDNVNGTPFWASTTDNHVIRLGSKIKFVIKSVQEESFLDICGSLKAPNTGCVNWLISSSEKIPALDSERKKKKNEKKRERIIENMGDEIKDDGLSRKDLHLDYIKESGYKQKSISKRNDRDTEVGDGGKDSSEFSAEYFYERGCKHKSKRKLNADIEAKDGGIVGNESPADLFHEREHKHKSKRKRDNIDAIM